MKNTAMALLLPLSNACHYIAVSAMDLDRKEGRNDDDDDDSEVGRVCGSQACISGGADRVTGVEGHLARTYQRSTS